MRKLINYIISFFKGFKKETKIELTEHQKPSERSKEHKQYYNFLKAKHKKATKNKNKRYASTKGF